MTTFSVIFQNIHNPFFYKCTLQYFTIFFLKNELITINTQICRVVCRIFSYRQNPPHPTTVLRHCPAFKSNNSYFSPAQSTTLPNHRFFSRKINSVFNDNYRTLLLTQLYQNYYKKHYF